MNQEYQYPDRLLLEVERFNSGAMQHLCDLILYCEEMHCARCSTALKMHMYARNQDPDHAIKNCIIRLECECGTPTIILTVDAGVATLAWDDMGRFKAAE